MLPRHNGPEGRLYRTHAGVLLEQFSIGPDRPGLLYEAARAAALWVEFEAATGALAAARRVRLTSKGRRPSLDQVGRLQQRMLSANAAYAAALESLRAGASPWSK